MQKKNKQFFIEIPGQKDEQKETSINAINKRLNWQQNMIYGVMIVVALGFITMIIASFDIFIQNRRHATEKCNEYIHVLKSKNEIIEKKQDNTQSKESLLKNENSPTPKND